MLRLSIAQALQKIFVFPAKMPQRGEELGRWWKDHRSEGRGVEEFLKEPLKKE